MIPSTLQVGLSWEWDAAFSDYPASTWTLVYTLINSTHKITVTASADDDDFSVAVAAATTAGYNSGTYSYQATVTDQTDVYLVEEGTATVNPSFSAATTLDTRTHVKTTLDAIEATIAGKASNDQQMVMIGGRQITSWSPSELLKWRAVYKSEYAAELKKERIANGLASGTKIKVRFSSL